MYTSRGAVSNTPKGPPIIHSRWDFSNARTGGSCYISPRCLPLYISGGAPYISRGAPMIHSQGGSYYTLPRRFLLHFLKGGSYLYVAESPPTVRSQGGSDDTAPRGLQLIHSQGCFLLFAPNGAPFVYSPGSSQGVLLLYTPRMCSYFIFPGNFRLHHPTGGSWYTFNGVVLLYIPRGLLSYIRRRFFVHSEGGSDYSTPGDLLLHTHRSAPTIHSRRKSTPMKVPMLFLHT